MKKFLAIVLCVGLVLAMPVATTANGSYLVVTNGNDSGPGSLRAVVADVPAGSTITFASGVNEVILTSNEIAITRANITIDGGEGVTIRRCDASETPEFRIFSFATTNSHSRLTLQNLTIQNGKTSGDGGGLFAIRATIVLINCTFVGNMANRGGGLFLHRQTSVYAVNSVFTDNTANYGGAMYSYWSWTSGFPNEQFSGDFIMLNSTVSSNTTLNNNGTIVVHRYGGIWSQSFLHHVTVTNNTGGGIFVPSETALPVFNSIVSGNTDSTGELPLNVVGDVSDMFFFLIPGLGSLWPEFSLTLQFENLIEGVNGVTHAQIFDNIALNPTTGAHHVLYGSIADGTAPSPRAEQIVQAYQNWPTLGGDFLDPSPTLRLIINRLVIDLAHDQLGAPRATTGAVTFGAVESTFTPPDCALCQDSGAYCAACNPSNCPIDPGAPCLCPDCDACNDSGELCSACNPGPCENDPYAPVCRCPACDICNDSGAYCSACCNPSDCPVNPNAPCQCPDCTLCNDSGDWCDNCNPEPPPPSSMPIWLQALISFASGALGVFALVLGWVWVR